MDGAINNIVEWVLNAIASVLLTLIQTFTDVFGYQGTLENIEFRAADGSGNYYSTGIAIENGDQTLNLFVSVFPFINDVWTLCYYMGYFILFTIMVWQIFKALFGDLTEAESPTKIVAKGVLTGAAVGLSSRICLLFFLIGAVPYRIIQGLEYYDSTQLTNVDAAKLFTAGGTAVALGSLAPGVLAFIMVCAFSILIQEFFKLMCEAVERYVILGLLTVFSPLCIATAVSGSTNRIFGSWFRMMISQAILMSTNVLFLKGFAGGFVAWIGYMLGETSILDNIGNVEGYSSSAALGAVIWLMLVAWLKLGQKIDEYLNMLGLSAAISGGFGTSILGNLRGAAMTANSMINARYGTRYGAPGEARNPVSQLFTTPFTTLRNRRLDAMRTDGIRKTVPGAGIDAFAKGMYKVPGSRSFFSNRDLTYAKKNGIPLNGSQLGSAFAKANKINTEGWGKFTNNCRYDPRSNTVTLEAKDKNGNITRAQYGFTQKGGIKSGLAKAANITDGTTPTLLSAEGAHVDTLLNGINRSNMAAMNNSMSNAVFDSNGNIIPGAVALDENKNAINANGDIVKNADADNPMHEGLAQTSALNEMYDKAGIKDNNGNIIEGAAYLDAEGNARDISGNIIKDHNEVGSNLPEYKNIAPEMASQGVFDSNNQLIPGAVAIDAQGNAIGKEGEIIQKAGAEPMHTGLVDNNSLSAMYKDAHITDAGGKEIANAAYVDADGNARNLNGAIVHDASALGSATAAYKSMASEYDKFDQGFIHSGMAVPNAKSVSTDGYAVNAKGEYITDKFGENIRAEANSNGQIVAMSDNIMMSAGTTGCVNAATNGKTYSASECNTNIDDAGFTGVGSTAYVWGKDENGVHDAYRITNPGTRYDKDNSGNYTESATGQYVMRSSSEGGGYIKADMTSDGMPSISYRSSSAPISEFSRGGQPADSSSLDTSYYVSGTSSNMTPAATAGDVYISSSNGDIYKVAESSKNISDGGLIYNNGMVTCEDPYHSGQTIEVKPKSDAVYSSVDTFAGFSYSNGSIDTSRYNKVSDDLGVSVWTGTTDSFEMRDAQTLSAKNINDMNNEGGWISHRDKNGNEFYMHKNNDITTGSYWTEREGETLTGAKADKFMDMYGLSDMKNNFDHIAIRNSQAILYNGNNISDKAPDSNNCMVVTADALKLTESTSKRNTADGIPYNVTPASIQRNNDGKITYSERSAGITKQIANYTPRMTSNVGNVINRSNIRSGTFNANVRSKRPVTEDYEDSDF